LFPIILILRYLALLFIMIFDILICPLLLWVANVLQSSKAWIYRLLLFLDLLSRLFSLTVLLLIFMDWWWLSFFNNRYLLFLNKCIILFVDDNLFLRGGFCISLSLLGLISGLLFCDSRDFHGHLIFCLLLNLIFGDWLWLLLLLSSLERGSDL
jgi:hypothetical protein